MAARFVMSSPTVEGLAQDGLPEVAFTGRSNVGKSSLVGSLVNKPALVRTSRTPGRTQLLNLFIWDDRLSIVDLPGYGYAKLSRTERTRMDAMAKAYMARRDTLCGVVLVLDCRREDVTEGDRNMAGWAMQHNRPLLLAATKCDLVPKTRRLHFLRNLEKAMGVPPGWALMCSSKTTEGQDELRKRLWELVKT
jgi:GTP-binding protein